MSRNAYDIIFRVVELGVALWFPCVLWNCMSPEQLWILNPKKILKKLDIDRTLELGQKVPQKSEYLVSGLHEVCLSFGLRVHGSFVSYFVAESVYKYFANMNCLFI